MPSRDELDAMLLRYLQREEDDPIRKRLENQAEWMQDHEKRDEQRHAEIVRALDGHNWRLQTLEAQQTNLKQEVEDTGEHRVQALQQELTAARGQLEKRDDTRRNFWIGVASAVLGGIVVAMVAAHFGLHP